MVIFWCLLLVPLFVTGEANPLQRIINGQLAKERQFPYVVQVWSVKDNASNVCGGSIIANNWVLTAAHCTENATRVSITYGTIHRQENPDERLIVKDRVYPHPQYQRIGSVVIHDIALIRTEWVEFSTHIQSIPLPTVSYSVGQTATVAGWGQLYDNHIGSDRLYWAWLHVIDKIECRYRYGNNLEGVLCARSDTGQSACTGDSGGPLVVYEPFQLIGVVSFGSGLGCEAGEPVGFSDVSKYLDWIYSVSRVTP